MLTAPSMRESDFERVRQLRLDRLRQLKDLAPAVAERAFLKLLYPSHPYGHLAIGSDASLRELTLEESSVPQGDVPPMAGDAGDDRRAVARRSAHARRGCIRKVGRRGRLMEVPSTAADFTADRATTGRSPWSRGRARPSP
jgi:hypothetical protein